MSTFLSKNSGVIGHLIVTIAVLVAAILVWIFVPGQTAVQDAMNTVLGAVVGYWFGSAVTTPQTAQISAIIMQAIESMFTKQNVTSATNTSSTSTPANTTPVQSATPVAAQPVQATPQAATTNTGENGPELVNLPRGASAQPLQGNNGAV